MHDYHTNINRNNGFAAAARRCCACLMHLPASEVNMIVVGTDFSEDALSALSVAETLSHTLATSVHIVHVRPHAEAAMPAGAAEWLRRARLSQGDVVIKTGTAWLELLRYAEDHDAEMICIAAHGNSGYQALAAGSNTRRLLLRSSVPVVVAPAVAKTTRPREMQT